MALIIYRESVLHNHLKIYYFQYPTGMLEDCNHWTWKRMIKQHGLVEWQKFVNWVIDFKPFQR